MKKRFVIYVSIIAILILASAVSADNPWVDVTAEFSGIEYITNAYQNGNGIWVIETHSTGEAFFDFDDDGEPEEQGYFELWSKDLLVNGLDDPESAVIHAEILITDSDSNGEFFCKGHGIGRFGKFNTIKATGEWEKQKIKAGYEILSEFGPESPKPIEAIMFGKWKNPNLNDD